MSCQGSPGPTLGDGSRSEVGLVEVVVVHRVQRPEQRVEWRVVAAVAKVEPAHEADDPLLPLGRHRRRHVVVRKHGGDLQVLHDAPGVVGVPGAHHAANVGALEVVRCPGSSSSSPHRASP